MKPLQTLFVYLIISQVFQCLLNASAETIDPRTLKIVLKNFIRVEGMKMDEYNYWWSPLGFADCYEMCITDHTFDCRSFSYSPEGELCSTYENDRSTAPSVYYNPSSFRENDPYGPYKWDYYERKSSKYRALENQVDRLKNLTDISMDEASSVLTSVAEAIRPPTTSDSTKYQTKREILPSELEIAGQSLLLVMKLNPIASAPLDGIKEFTDVVANVSSVLTDSSYASAWHSAQRNPASPGSAAIVTSTEQLTRDVSAKLLKAQNATSGISTETESIGMWMDFEYAYPQLSEEESDYSILRDLSSIDMNGLDLRVDEMSSYIFPKRNRFPTTTVGPLLPATNNTNTSEATPISDEDDFFQDTIILPRAALGNKSMVTNVRYKNLKNSMPTRCTADKEVPEGKKVQANIVNSAVLTTSIFPRPNNSVFQEQPVIIIFKHDREPVLRSNITLPQNQTNETAENQTDETRNSSSYGDRVETIFCVFWQDGVNENDGGLWSTDGCSVVQYNSTHTICNCSHLTSFAVLLQIVDYEVDNDLTKIQLRILSIISKVGCILSLLGVTAMCAAFIKLKFHTENMKIHFNLGVAVGFADFVFLFEELAEQSKPSCIVVTVLLYYFNMTVLAWMLIEGIHLYSQVVVVFVSARRWFKYYVVAGWGVPVVALVVSMGTLNVQIGIHEICWLSPADNSIWAFAAPALVVIVINTIILITVVRVIFNIQPEKSNHMKVSKLRNAVKGSIFLFPLLGTTWLFGLLSLSQETLLFQYLFTITNSLQGFLLFVFHCLCNSEVREDVRRHKWFQSSKSISSSSSPHLHNNSLFSLNVTSGLRKFRNSVTFETPTSSSADSDVTDSINDVRNKSLGKFLSMFQKFSMKLPATVPEGDEKYEMRNRDGADSTDAMLPRTNSSVCEESTFDMEISFGALKPLPLPGMPIKNDQITISTTRFKIPAPQNNKTKSNQSLEEQTDKNVVDGNLDKCPVEAKEDAIKNFAISDEEEHKMTTSYDSGLNSIDNESILEEDDETWMANQQLKEEDQPKEVVVLN